MLDGMVLLWQPGDKEPGYARAIRLGLEGGTEMDLSARNVGDREAIYVASALLGNTTLARLDLSGSQVF